MGQAWVFEWFCCFTEEGIFVENAKHPEYLPTNKNNDAIAEVYDLVQVTEDQLSETDEEVEICHSL
jgi:hypothetical protein